MNCTEDLKGTEFHRQILFDLYFGLFVKNFRCQMMYDLLDPEFPSYIRKKCISASCLFRTSEVCRKLRNAFSMPARRPKALK